MMLRTACFCESTDIHPQKSRWRKHHHHDNVWPEPLSLSSWCDSIWFYTIYFSLFFFFLKRFAPSYSQFCLWGLLSRACQTWLEMTLPNSLPSAWLPDLFWLILKIDFISIGRCWTLDLWIWTISRRTMAKSFRCSFSVLCYCHAGPRVFKTKTIRVEFRAHSWCLSAGLKATTVKQYLKHFEVMCVLHNLFRGIFGWLVSGTVLAGCNILISDIWYIWYYTSLQRLWIQKGLISPPVQGSKDLLIQHLQIFFCRWFCMSGLKEEPALYDSLFLPLLFPTFSPGRDGGGYSQVWTLSDPGGLSEVMTFLMCSSRPVHFLWAFLVGVAKSQVALAPSKFVGCLGSISEVASNWPRQECLVDCLSLIRTGHSVGEVFLLLRRRCMEETSGIEDGLAASSFYTAGFLTVSHFWVPRVLMSPCLLLPDRFRYRDW